MPAHSLPIIQEFIDYCEMGTCIPYGHIYTHHSAAPAYERIRLETPDDDFLDLDFLRSGKQARVVLVLHGIDGNTDRHYVRGFSEYAQAERF